MNHIDKILEDNKDKMSFVITLVLVTMTRTAAVLIAAFYVIMVSEAWKPLNTWLRSGPLLNTFSRSSSKPMFLSAKSYLSVLPNVNINPKIPIHDEFSPEPFEINEKTLVILHKVHSVIVNENEEEEADSREEDDLSSNESSENSEEDTTKLKLSLDSIDSSEDLSTEDSREMSSEEYLEQMYLENKYTEMINEDKSKELDSDDDLDFTNESS